MNFHTIEVKKTVFHKSKYTIKINEDDIKRYSYLTNFHMVKKVLNTLLDTLLDAECTGSLRGRISEWCVFDTGWG